MTNTQSPFVWYDLMAHDVASARKFYGSVVGWNFTDSGAPNEPYAIINAGKIGIGGMMSFRADDSKSIPPFWSGYIYVPDVDAKIKDIEARGGKLYRGPIDVPGMVRFAIVLDPHGAMFNILTPLTDGPQEKVSPGTPGHVGWNELHAGELGSAWDFYSGLFGWTKGTSMDMGTMGIYQIFQIDGKDVGGMMKRQEMLPTPMWLYYFNVDGIDAAVTRITKSGGKIAMGPHQVPGGQWIVSAFDPQGGSFQLLSATK
jgi:uncharacterized protein